jgi:hypothetical protein
MIGDPGAFREGIRPAGLLAALERQPPPLVSNHILFREVETRAGIVELLHERLDTVGTGRPIADSGSRIPGSKGCAFALGGTEEESPAAAHRILVGAASRPHAHCQLSQTSTEYHVHGESMA